MSPRTADSPQTVPANTRANEGCADAIVPARLTLNGRTLDRRAFLGTMGLTAGAVLAGQFLTAGLARASTSGQPAAMSAAHESHGLGHVDDICGHWPRYAHPIPFGPVRSGQLAWDNVDPADLNFMA